jgi:Fe2+ transport system protein FeoA
MATAEWSDPAALAVPDALEARGTIDALMPLPMIPVGTTARVVEVVGGCATTQRLRELGLCRGARVRLVSTEGKCGGCLVAVGHRKLGFRAGELTSVLVQPDQAEPVR